MHQDIQTIVNHLFSKPSLEEVSTREIEELISKYPYFAPARYMLAKKLYRDDDLNVEDKLVTAGLYIQNPLRLHWLLNQQPDTIISAEIAGNQIVQPAEPEPEIIATPEPLAEEITQMMESAAPVPDPETLEKEQQPNIVTATSGVPDTVPEPKTAVAPPDTVQQPAPAPAPQLNDSPIEFQSYHTIDYFASQGIRLQAADLGKDKFGQQLRSFTEWLRSMKKLPASSRQNLEDEGNHQHVMMKAAYSLAEREIVTEAMAEVWAKQGHKQKAIDIYNKLSLQNPAKSGYFAAKIDILKAL